MSFADFLADKELGRRLGAALEGNPFALRQVDQIIAEVRAYLDPEPLAEVIDLAERRGER